ncbi:MAG TPA: type II secretion system minor pseudopilin GspH [Nevskiaceae bacterium]
MPTSATGTSISSTGRRDGDACRGFTLIEISVVLFIVGILAGAATLSITSRPLQERQHVEAQRLRQLIGLAADQAQLQGRQVGLRVSGDGYAFVSLDDARRWIPFTQGDLRTRRLPQPFTLRLSIEDTTDAPSSTPVTVDQLPATDPAVGDASGHRLAPQVLFLSSGEATPFRLDVLAPGEAQDWQVSGDALGNMTLAQVVAP